MANADTLRERYPTFVFESAEWQKKNSSLNITYRYSLPPDHQFTHKLSIPLPPEGIEHLDENQIDTLVFNLGMAEIFSYWKLTNSPEIRIEAGWLDEDQIAWWHDLLIKGMGEFFYVNDTDFTVKDFVKFTVAGEKPHAQKTRKSGKAPKKPSVLIPIGGGKDSVVTLSLFETRLRSDIDELGALMVNPTKAAENIVSSSTVSTENSLVVSRMLDKKILGLNKQGYLNGHIPISAVFAFTSLLTAYLHGYTHIPLSNERSSNEGNAEFHGYVVNHQYSKSYEFEVALQQYAQNYLFPDTEPGSTSPLYFSFLRPLYELQIGKIFAGMNQYHHLFRSCNRGQATNSWCGACSKCLFASLCIFPFMPMGNLKHIIDEPVFSDSTLLPLAREMAGYAEAKPFECVGTHEEAIVSYYLAIEHWNKHSVIKRLPKVLMTMEKEVLSKEKNLESRARELMASWNTEHSVPKEWARVLQDYLEAQ